MRNDSDHTDNHSTHLAGRKLVLARETLRIVTSDELRLAALSAATSPSNSDGVSCNRRAC